MENSNLTVREIVTTINTMLSENFKKPIIQTEYKRYDTENGRKVIEPCDIARIMRELTGIVYIFTKKYDIVLHKTQLIFKTKRKKSNIIDRWEDINRFTVVEIYVENEFLLDKTFAEILDEANLEEYEQKKVEDIKNDEIVDNFIRILKENKIKFQAFLSLSMIYNHMGHEVTRKINDHFIDK